MIGSCVNIEAGAIVANHFNEKSKEEREIKVFIDNKLIETNSIKFGAIIGDNSKIGANAVLSPGTILMPNHIVGRLELVKQIEIKNGTEGIRTLDT